MPKPPKNPLQPGQRFGRLTVIEYAGRDEKYGRQLYRCHCDCGNEITTAKNYLTAGKAKSCGCSRQKPETRLQPGQRFGLLTVVEYADHDKHGNQLYRCRCDCGNEYVVPKDSLVSGKTKSCGCIKKKSMLQPGKRFGRLTVVEFAGRDKNSKQLYRCRCDCGNKITARRDNLISGGMKSCGCLAREIKNPLQPGQRFGRLTVIEYAGREEKYGKQLYRCQCDCGNEITVQRKCLISGNTKSCGCLNSDLSSERIYECVGFQDGTCISNIKLTRPNKNNATGVRGVSWNRERGCFVAQLQFQGKRYVQRGFKTIAEAAKCRQSMYDEIVQPYLDSLDAKGNTASRGGAAE